MYTLLNNMESSKLDLYLPGRLVASLHYRFTTDEMWFVYCESIDDDSPDSHCREVLRRGLEEAHSRRMRVHVLCTISQRLLTGATAGTDPLVIEPGRL